MNTRRLPSLIFTVLALGGAVLGADTITGLGRVLPASGVIDLAGVTGDTILKVNVNEGDWVQANQSLAELSSAADEAKKVTQLEGDLAAVKRNTAVTVEIDRQNLALMKLQSKYSAERYHRVVAAPSSDFISPDQAPDREVAMRTAELSEAQAQAAIDSAIQDSDKAVRAAEADLAAARVQLSLAEVRSPIKAKVLKIRGRVGGAAVGPLFKLGDTSSMIVVAEIYQAEALKLKVGQRATISSTALPGKMTGRIQSVSSIVFRNSIESTDPNDTGDSRIVEATIKMDDPSPLDRLVYLQVDVVIDI